LKKAGIFIFALSPAYVSSANTFSTAEAETKALETRTKGWERLEELDRLSQALVLRAASGAAPAHEFRIEARMYRELLRNTMLENREQPDSQQLPKPLLLDMVRMSALLHSAADCKTGFVITCPTDLMQQLKSQQARVTQGLAMTRAISE
jgi:hypothetical protein